MAFVSGLALRRTMLSTDPAPFSTMKSPSRLFISSGSFSRSYILGGESMSANAVLDVGGLRRARRRVGMANVLSRQAYGLFAESYAQADFHRGNFLLDDGKVVEPPNRDVFRQRQERNVERLIKAGLL